LAVHPHGRGDNRHVGLRTLPPRGSPPRAWGQCYCVGQRRNAPRFTPTGVGTMALEVFAYLAAAVHPHGRGDNAIAHYTLIAPDGSPPRAWGQLQQEGSDGQFDRFTPTGVGTIATRTVIRSVIAVHPHGRGDNDARTSCCHNTFGSPPRAWGQLARRPQDRGVTRFTPTGVGTIVGMSPLARQRSVHPHGRGDNVTYIVARLISLGSPPRAWGQFRRVTDCVDYSRFTPTGVGTICIRSERGSDTTVHPHGRGDNPIHAVHPSSPLGSPPRAWGQLPKLRGTRFHARFTPTGVGTMRRCAQSSSATAVHPHGRGDNESVNTDEIEQFGSPPRAWGQS